MYKFTPWPIANPLDNADLWWNGDKQAKIEEAWRCGSGTFQATFLYREIMYPQPFLGVFSTPNLFGLVKTNSGAFASLAWFIWFCVTKYQFKSRNCSWNHVLNCQTCNLKSDHITNLFRWCMSLCKIICNHSSMHITTGVQEFSQINQEVKRIWNRRCVVIVSTLCVLPVPH